jgi:hypothetical protein
LKHAFFSMEIHEDEVQLESPKWRQLLSKVPLGMKDVHRI